MKDIIRSFIETKYQDVTHSEFTYTNNTEQEYFYSFYSGDDEYSILCKVLSNKKFILYTGYGYEIDATEEFKQYTRYNKINKLL